MPECQSSVKYAVKFLTANEAALEICCQTCRDSHLSAVDLFSQSTRLLQVVGSGGHVVRAQNMLHPSLYVVCPNFRSSLLMGPMVMISRP